MQKIEQMSIENIDILSLILKLNPNKANGSDGISDIYPIPPQTSPWAYNRILDVCHFLNFKTALVYKPMGL